MKTLKFFIRDMRLGLIDRWYVFVLPIFFAVAQGWQCHKLIEYFRGEEILHSNVTVMDYFLYSMEGMPVFHFDPKEYFTIPIYWFVFQIGISFIVAYYAHNDFVENGRALFIASRNCKAWWKSKCLWCVSAVVVYYAITAIAIIVVATCFGAKMSLQQTLDFTMAIFGSNMAYVSTGECLLIAVLLPFGMTLAICIVQLLFSFLVSPVISFAGSCAVYVLSAYYTSSFFIGNYTMWLRSSFIAEDGLAPSGGFIALGALIAVSYIGGKSYFTNKDVF